MQGRLSRFGLVAATAWLGLLNLCRGMGTWWQPVWTWVNCTYIGSHAIRMRAFFFSSESEAASPI